MVKLIFCFFFLHEKIIEVNRTPFSVLLLSFLHPFLCCYFRYSKVAKVVPGVTEMEEEDDQFLGFFVRCGAGDEGSAINRRELGKDIGLVEPSESYGEGYLIPMKLLHAI